MTLPTRLRHLGKAGSGTCLTLGARGRPTVVDPAGRAVAANRSPEGKSDREDESGPGPGNTPVLYDSGRGCARARVGDSSVSGGGGRRLWVGVAWGDPSRFGVL